MQHSASSESSFASKSAITVSMSAAFIAILAVLWYAADVLLIIFAGILFAILLHGLATGVSRWTGFSNWVSLLLIVLTLLVASLSGFALTAHKIAQQADQLIERIPNTQEALAKQVSQYQWGRQLMKRLSSAQQGTGGVSWEKLFGRISSAFSSTFGLLADLVIIVVIGLYVAVSPDNYKGPLVRLFPPSKRPDSERILDQIGLTLWYWLMGRTIAMLVIFAVTSIGLALLGIPGALALGLLAGLLNFIPNIGPLISVIPAVLVASTVSSTQILYVVLLYSGIQLVESYVLTPLIQKRSVKLEPAFTIAMQFVLGVLIGLPGLALATPLTAAGVVLVKELYLAKLEPVA